MFPRSQVQFSIDKCGRRGYFIFEIISGQALEFIGIAQDGHDAGLLHARRELHRHADGTKRELIRVRGRGQ